MRHFTFGPYRKPRFRFARTSSTCSPESKARRYLVAPAFAAILIHVAYPANSQGVAIDPALRTCHRDGKNLVDRVERFTKEKGIRSALARRSADLQGEIDRYQSRCIEKPGLAALEGFAEVNSLRDNAQATLNGIQRQSDENQKKAATTAAASTPGGSNADIRNRWRNRPQSCRQEDSAKPRRNIVDSDILDAARPDAARYVVEHFACGAGIPGIDEYGSILADSEYRFKRSQGALSEALLTDTLSADERTVYQGMLLAACFHENTWSLKKEYLSWIVCEDESTKAKSPAEVLAAFKRLYPVSTKFEQDNVVYLVTKGQSARTETATAFTALEQKFPKLRRDFREARNKSLQQRIALRKRYAEIIEPLDGFTRKVTPELSATLPRDCYATLTGFREKLARDIRPSDEKSVATLTGDHPVGYQITEAMILCSIANGHMARAERDARQLQGHLRNIEPRETAYLAVRLVEQNVKDKFGQEQRNADYPGIDYFHQNLPVRPHTVAVVKGKLEMYVNDGTPYRIPYAVADKASFMEAGREERKPAVVEAITKRGATAKVTFKLVKWKIPIFVETNCRTTSRVVKWEFKGNAVIPIYERLCDREFDHWEQLSHQEPSVTIPAEDAALAKPGEMVELIVRDGNREDASILNAYEVAKGQEGSVLRGAPRTLGGVRLN